MKTIMKKYIFIIYLLFLFFACQEEGVRLDFSELDPQISNIELTAESVSVLINKNYSYGLTFTTPYKNMETFLKLKSGGDFTFTFRDSVYANNFNGFIPLETNSKTHSLQNFNLKFNSASPESPILKFDLYFRNFGKGNNDTILFSGVNIQKQISVRNPLFRIVPSNDYSLLGTKRVVNITIVTTDSLFNPSLDYDLSGENIVIMGLKNVTPSSSKQSNATYFKENYIENGLTSIPITFNNGEANIALSYQSNALGRSDLKLNGRSDIKDTSSNSNIEVGAGVFTVNYNVPSLGLVNGALPISYNLSISPETSAEGYVNRDYEIYFTSNRSDIVLQLLNGNVYSDYNAGEGNGLRFAGNNGAGTFYLRSSTEGRAEVRFFIKELQNNTEYSSRLYDINFQTGSYLFSPPSFPDNILPNTFVTVPYTISVGDNLSGTNFKMWYETNGDTRIHRVVDGNTIEQPVNVKWDINNILDRAGNGNILLKSISTGNKNIVLKVQDLVTNTVQSQTISFSVSDLRFVSNLNANPGRILKRNLHPLGFNIETVSESVSESTLSGKQFDLTFNVTNVDNSFRVVYQGREYRELETIPLINLQDTIFVKSEKDESDLATEVRFRFIERQSRSFITTDRTFNFYNTEFTLSSASIRIFGQDGVNVGNIRVESYINNSNSININDRNPLNNYTVSVDIDPPNSYWNYVDFSGNRIFLNNINSGLHNFYFKWNTRYLYDAVDTYNVIVTISRDDNDNTRHTYTIPIEILDDRINFSLRHAGNTGVITGASIRQYQESDLFRIHYIDPPNPNSNFKLEYQVSGEGLELYHNDVLQPLNTRINANTVDGGIFKVVAVKPGTHNLKVIFSELLSNMRVGATRTRNITVTSAPAIIGNHFTFNRNASVLTNNQPPYFGFDIENISPKIPVSVTINKRNSGNGINSDSHLTLSGEATRLIGSFTEGSNFNILSGATNYNLDYNIQFQNNSDAGNLTYAYNVSFGKNSYGFITSAQNINYSILPYFRLLNSSDSQEYSNFHTINQFEENTFKVDLDNISYGSVLNIRFTISGSGKLRIFKGDTEVLVNGSLSAVAHDDIFTIIGSKSGRANLLVEAIHNSGKVNRKSINYIINSFGNIPITYQGLPTIDSRGTERNIINNGGTAHQLQDPRFQLNINGTISNKVPNTVSFNDSAPNPVLRDGDGGSFTNRRFLIGVDDTFTGTINNKTISYALGWPEEEIETSFNVGFTIRAYRPAIFSFNRENDSSDGSIIRTDLVGQPEQCSPARSQSYTVCNYGPSSNSRVITATLERTPCPSRHGIFYHISTSSRTRTIPAVSVQDTREPFVRYYIPHIDKRDANDFSSNGIRFTRPTTRIIDRGCNHSDNIRYEEGGSTGREGSATDNWGYSY